VKNLKEFASFFLFLVIFFLIFGLVDRLDYEDGLRFARIYENLEAKREANEGIKALCRKLGKTYS
jgi:hypothetical protein